MLSEFPNFAFLHSAFYRVFFLVEIVIFSRLLFFARLIVPVRHINAPVCQLLAIPFVGECVPIPVAEATVVEYDVCVQLFGCRLWRNDFTRHLRVAQFLARTISHITSDNDVFAIVFIHQQFTQRQHFGVAFDARFQPVELFAFNLAWVCTHSVNLPIVHSNL